MKYSKLLSFTLFMLPVLTHADVAVENNHNLEANELETSGFSIQVSQSKIFCNDSNEVIINVPKEFNGREYFSTRLNILDETLSSLYLDTNITTIDAPKDDFLELPEFHGIELCIHDNLLNSAQFIFLYGVRGMITDTVTIGSINEYKQ